MTILAIILTRGSLVQQRNSVLLTVEISLPQKLHAWCPLLGCEGFSLREEKDPGVLIEILQPLSLLEHGAELGGAGDHRTCQGLISE